MQDDLDSITVFLGRRSYSWILEMQEWSRKFFITVGLTRRRQPYDDWKKEVLQNERRLSVKEKPDGKEKSYVLYNLVINYYLIIRYF